MRRIAIAFRALVRVLFDAAAADQVDAVLRGQPPALAPPEAEAAKKPRPKPSAAPKPRPTRSEALTLLATLQREARLVDFVQESLEGYADAQIGAAARDVHRDCKKVLDRLFGLEPVLEEEEGAEVEVAEGFDPGRYHLTGNVAGEPPFRGRLAHHGWRASRCELPGWSGSDEAARVVAPAEVELS